MYGDFTVWLFTLELFITEDSSLFGYQLENEYSIKYPEDRKIISLKAVSKQEP